jgi:ribosome-associated protein
MGKGGGLVINDVDAGKRALWCVNAALEKKAKGIILLNVKELSAFTDYFLICSGASDRQVQAIASSIREKMKKDGLLPLGVEGESHGQWILMDYEDVVVHIFYEPLREFYDIERLWSEAPRMDVDENAVELTALDPGL